MNKTLLNQGMLGAMLLVTAAVNAQEYPAADFQPKVVYRDEAIASPAAAAPAQAPCVSQGQSALNEAKSEIDPKYPAANFQPKVIFSDAKL